MTDRGMKEKPSVGGVESVERQVSTVRERTAGAISTLTRWGKFNLVGAIGIGVQFSALFLLKSVLHLDYLAATAIAVEAAVLHNFVWHERFTWVDRIWVDRIRVDRISSDRIGAGTSERDPGPAKTTLPLSRMGRSCGSFRRLWRFHLANGTVSVLGNLTLMKVLVGVGHMNYLLANMIAIAVCSLANFLMSDQWVFEN